MASTKKALSKRQTSAKAPKSHYGLWPTLCVKEHKGIVCGGKQFTDYKRHFDRDQATNLVIPDSEHKKYFCERCGGEIREPIGPRRYYDPQNRNPLMSEHSVKAAKDPYRKLG